MMMIMVTASCCVELKVDRTLRHALLIIIYIFIRSKNSKHEYKLITRKVVKTRTFLRCE